MSLLFGFTELIVTLGIHLLLLPFGFAELW